MGKRYHCVVISDFNMSNFAGYLGSDITEPQIDVRVGPFGQIVNVLLDKNAACWHGRPDCAIVWTKPEAVIGSFNNIIASMDVSMDHILKEVDEYSSLLMDARERVKCLLIPTWTFPYHYNAQGLCNMKNNSGIARALMRMNLRLSENMEHVSQMHVLYSQKWIEQSGRQAFCPKLWYMGKVAFGNDVFIEAVKDVKGALTGIGGDSKKLIILDLDDTLWGGIVGDEGWHKIILGGHDPLGEAYVDFQRALKSLTRRGVLLGIVSKNDEAVALEAMQRHPEMVLKVDDFAGWRINWADKAQNIVDLIADLNILPQSVVFIDNDPIERSRVRTALPDVFVPEWPNDKMLYTNSLYDLRCFDMPLISREDAERTKIYVSERQKKHFKKKIGSIDEWLTSLDIKVVVEDFSKANLQRIIQLLNKTNQMNLATRRMGEDDLLAWVSEVNRKLWTFRVGDRFGDSGLVGILSVEIDAVDGQIVDFVLSCRVIGRKVEEAMLYTAINYARSSGVEILRAEYIPTGKNAPCLNFWKTSGFIYREESNCFMWHVKDEYTPPQCITLSMK